MKILFYDTETTGLPNKKEKDLSKQPHMVQFAWIIWELNDKGDWNKESEINILVRPPIPIPYQSSEVHHIYDIDVLDKPYIVDEIKRIADIINWVDLVVWHNIAFDNFIIQTEIQRAKLLWIMVDFQPKNIFCTMEWTKDWCKLKNKQSDTKYKRPKLSELYRKLFWQYFIWAHDAMIDVKATWRCFVELNNRWIINPLKMDEKLTLF